MHVPWSCAPQPALLPSFGRGEQGTDSAQTVLKGKKKKKLKSKGKNRKQSLFSPPLSPEGMGTAPRCRRIISLTWTSWPRPSV